jgi:hypothetical protein
MFITNHVAKSFVALFIATIFSTSFAQIGGMGFGYSGGSSGGGYIDSLNWATVGTSRPAGALNSANSYNVADMRVSDSITAVTGKIDTISSQILNVNGTIQTTGFKLTTAPTAGYVLTSDATGIGTWQAVGGGSTGEYIEATASQPCTTGIALNVTSLELTPGDWDVTGRIGFTYSSAAVTLYHASISLTSGTQDADYFVTDLKSGTLTGETSVALPTRRVNIVGNVNVYLVVLVIFGPGTVNAGGMLRARRVR